VTDRAATFERVLALDRSGRRCSSSTIAFTAFVSSPEIPLLAGELHPELKPAAPGTPRGFGMPSSSGSPSARVLDALARGRTSP
jgi:hypothetical protein